MIRALLLLSCVAGAARADEGRLVTLLRWYLDERKPSRQEDLLEMIERASGRDPAAVAAAVAGLPGRTAPAPLAVGPPPEGFDAEKPRLLDLRLSAGTFARLSLPRGFDPATPWPLVVDLGARGLPAPADALRAVVEATAFSSAIVAETCVLSLVAHLVRDACADPDRVYLRGQGPAAALAIYIALHNPDRFAGVVAVQGIWEGAAALADNARPLRMLGVERRRGESPLRSFLDRIARENPAHAILQGAEEGGEATRAIEAWGKGPPRPASPARIALSVQRPFAIRAYWLRATPTVRSEQRIPVGVWEATGMRRAGRIEASIENGNLVRVRTENIAAFDLFVDPALFDLERPLRVSINGGVPEARVIAPSIGDLLEDFAERRDPRRLYLQRLTFSVPGR